MTLLENKVALISGSGRGIGAATALLFAQQGARVIVSDIDSDMAEETVALIKANGGSALAIPCDVTRTDGIQHLIEGTIAAYQRIDILVNNAGYTWDSMFHKMNEEQWEAMLDVHLSAPFRLIHAAMPYMRESAKREIEAHGYAQPRKIVNISSTTGTRGKVGQANYAAAKAGIIGLSKTLAKEWGGFNIQVNVVAFGMIDTRLTQPKDGALYTERDSHRITLGIPQNMRETAMNTIPMGRPGTPEEAAGVIFFFASPYSNYVSGQVLEVTGGL
jgi:3-oxoacyl-[acyl-carrier protein] reductase